MSNSVAIALIILSVLESAALFAGSRYVFLTTVREHATIEMLQRMLLAKNDPSAYALMTALESSALDDKDPVFSSGVLDESVLV